MYLLYLTFQFM